MVISGLVVKIEDPRQADVANALESHRGITLGEIDGARIPLVLEADDDRASRLAHDQIESLPGVVSVDVVFCGFDDDAAGLVEQSQPTS